jgi:glycosyltransferase involved in cell wall biosynthesis
VEDLASQLDRLLADPALVSEYRSRALERSRLYSWDEVTDQYEQLLTAVCEAQRPGRLPEFLVDRDPVVVS